MGIPDFVTMVKNFASSVVLVESFVFHLLYLVGICLLIAGIYGLAVFGMGAHADHDKKRIALLKIVIGAIFIFLPTTLSVMNTSFFGQGANLSYTEYKGFTLYDAVKIIAQTGGVVWFAHGVLMILKQDQGGREKSFKALVYIIAGTCALNFDYFVTAVSSILTDIMNYFKSLI